MTEKKKINIELSKEEALVLFDFIGRLNETEYQGLFNDQAEQRVLWNIESALEKELPEPFGRDYKEIIEQARNNVRDKE